MKKSILFAGQCYYNAWYLSRELRKLGWKADVLNIDPSEKNREMFYHGEDFWFSNTSSEEIRGQLLFFLNALNKYNIFHFSNARGMYVTQCFDSYTKQGKSLKGLIVNKVINLILKINLNLFIFISKLIIENLSFKVLNMIILGFDIQIPERWDIKLLKRMNKIIVYTNNGCLDGVSQTSFRKWKPYCVCDICIWKDNPSVCSDKRNLGWGRFRNEYADFQILLGGNRADYNVDDRIREVPGFYCLDQEFWNPDLVVPEEYLMENTAVKLYHAVGNYDLRTSNGNKDNIKSTHIYVPLVKMIKDEGYDVELVFVKDIPNKEVRYIMVQSDIVADMLTYGWFGANIREGMMLGKPCICYLRPEWLIQASKEIPDYIDELPIVNANPENIYEVLIDLITNEKKRKEIGRRSRDFAVKWHSSVAGAKVMDVIYASLLKN